jgi:hypothetical protein
MYPAYQAAYRWPVLGLQEALLQARFSVTVPLAAAATAAAAAGGAAARAWPGSCLQRQPPRRRTTKLSRAVTLRLAGNDSNAIRVTHSGYKLMLGKLSKLCARLHPAVVLVLLLV